MVNLNVRRATWQLVVWWVIANVAMQYGFNRLFQNGALFAPVHGLIVGLVAGLVLKKYTRLNGGQVLLIGLGWAGAELAASYVLSSLMRGVFAMGFLSRVNLAPFAQVISNPEIHYVLTGLFIGAIGGLITAMVLRRAALLAEGKALLVTLGWAAAWAVGFLAYQYTFRQLILTPLFRNYSLLPWLSMMAVIGLLTSTIGGRVMFTSIRNSQ